MLEITELTLQSESWCNFSDVTFKKVIDIIKKSSVLEASIFPEYIIYPIYKWALQVLRFESEESTNYCAHADDMSIFSTE